MRILPTPAGVIAPIAPKCGGCFKSVDVSTAVTGTVRPHAGRYGRFGQGPTAIGVEYFCNAACKRKADLD